jgi:hypothetical protein
MASAVSGEDAIAQYSHKAFPPFPLKALAVNVRCVLVTVTEPQFTLHSNITMMTSLECVVVSPGSIFEVALALPFTAPSIAIVLTTLRGLPNMTIGDIMFALACHAPNKAPQIASHVIRILRIVIRLAVEPSWNAFTDAETLTRTQR